MIPQTSKVQSPILAARKKDKYCPPKWCVINPIPAPERAYSAEACQAREDTTQQARTVPNAE